jgi:sec-independent protein translocase protein TatB
MFDIAWSELLVIAVVALVVIGPRDLPGALRTFGRMIGKVRRMASDFQGQFNEAMKEAELDGLRKELAELKRTTHGMLNVPNPSSLAREELRKSLSGSTPAAAATAAAAGSAEASAEAATAPAEEAATGVAGEPRPADLPVPARADTPAEFGQETKA